MGKPEPSQNAFRGISSRHWLVPGLEIICLAVVLKSKDTLDKAGFLLFYSWDGPLTAAGATKEAK